MGLANDYSSVSWQPCLWPRYPEGVVLCFCWPLWIYQQGFNCQNKSFSLTFNYPSLHAEAGPSTWIQFSLFIQLLFSHCYIHFLIQKALIWCLSSDEKTGEFSAYDQAHTRAVISAALSCLLRRVHNIHHDSLSNDGAAALVSSEGHLEGHRWER